MTRDARFLTFETAGQVYGLSTTRIREVLPIGTISPVSDTPAFVLGATTLRNEVLPVVDFQLLLGQGEPTLVDHRSCFVVALVHSKRAEPTSVCLVVRRVLDAYCFDTDQLESPPVIGGHSQATFLSGIGRAANGLKLLVDVDQLMANSIDLLSARTEHLAEISSHDSAPGSVQSAASERSRLLRVLSISVGGQCFGFPLEEISRIIPAGEFKTDATAPSTVRGAMMIEGERVGVVDLGARIGVCSDEAAHTDGVTDERSVVLVRHENVAIGYLIDSVGRLASLDRSNLRRCESFSGMVRHESCLLGFIETDGRPLEVLSFNGVLNAGERRAIQSWISTMDTARRIGEMNSDARTPAKELPEAVRDLAGSYLLVRAGRHCFGIRAVSVEAVADDDGLLVLPATRSDFAGVLDRRGRSFAVVDLVKRLDIDAGTADGCQSCIVLTHDGGAMTGARVDHVFGLKRVAPDQIRPDWKIDEPIHAKFVTAGAEVDNRRVWLLNLCEVLSEQGPSQQAKWRQFEKEAREAGAGEQLDAVVAAMSGN